MDFKDKKVVCSGKIRTVALDYLKDRVDLYPYQQKGRRPKEEWEELIKDADAIFCSGNIKVDSALLEKAPRLKVVGQAAVGYDNIDVAACRARGVRVGNTPGVLVNAVADLAWGLVIDTARGIVRGDRHVKSGLWGEKKALGMSKSLYGKTLGIVGMGDIGTAIAMRARVSGMDIVYNNRRRKLTDSVVGARYLSFEELLGASDFVLAAVSLNPSTEGLFDDRAFAAMKEGACFINISRGRVVKSDALYEALKSGHLYAAAVDVTDPEPLPGDHPLASLPNLTVTPHIASATSETRDEMALLTAQNIIAGLAGGPMPAEVK